MIDWTKLGPANSPTPATPDTTAPVAPAVPGGLALPTVQTGPKTFSQTTQAEVDAMSPLDRLGRGLSGILPNADGHAEGIDTLGQNLFGQGNGSPFGGIPLLGNIIGGAGNIAHGVGSAGLKPFEAAGGALARVPLGWLPGGSDEAFNRLGDWAKTANPEVYAEWQKVKAAADADVLYGGNLKADFNIELMKMIDDSQHDSSFGSTSVELQMGREGAASAGGALSHFITGFLGLAGNNAQRFLGEHGVFDPGAGPATVAEAIADHNTVGQTSEIGELVIKNVQSGAWTQEQGDKFLAAQQGTRNRVEEAMARLDAGGEVSDVEKKAIEAVRSGEWSMAHAQDYVVQHGQSITRNPIGQIIGSVLTDPLTYATLGAGSIAKAGKIGETIIEAGGAATKAAGLAERVAMQESLLAKYQVAVRSLQTVNTPIGKELGGAFRIARGLIDPFAVYKPNSVARATTDLMAGTATEAFWRAHGEFAVTDMRAIGREVGMSAEMDSDIASYAMEQAKLMVARTSVRDALQEGFGIELMQSNVDDVIQPLVQNASRDAITALTDHMLGVSKNTFTAEEEAKLGGRIAAAYGGDAAKWQARVATMSHELKSALHAVTYKRAEVEFERARALVNEAAYTGDLPLSQMALMSTDTLDNVVAEQVITNLRAVLKNEGKTMEDPIATATAEWNRQAMRYPGMANLGYATGGKEQVTKLVDALERKMESGGLSRRALEDELADPNLRAIRDMLDKHSLPGGLMSPEEQALADALVSPPLTPGEGVAKAPAGMASSTLKNGGGTFDAATGKAIAQGTGYGVATGASGKVVAAKAKDINEAYVAVSKTGAKHIGTWVNPEDGLVSVDPTQVIDSLDEAMRIAQARGEKAIFDFSTMTDIPVPAREAQMSVKRLWNVGFRPPEELAWGLKQDVNTGRYIVDRDPTISHIVNAVPGRQRFSDTTRNVLGQIIGPAKAERLNKPIDSIEAYVNTMRDGITGRRLVMNIERRYERITFDAGIPKPISKEIFKRAREVAGLDFTTVRGIKPDNLWDRISEIVPRDLVLKDGSTLNIHVVMDHLLEAAEGDLRIMGVTSVLSQRMRNALRQAGMDPANWAGQMTVTMYNKLRYSQPMFLIQRITDAPYYSILYGVTPIGKSLVTAGQKATRIIEENLGRTGMARDFSMDMPEYATRTNFTEGVKSAMQQKGLFGHRFDKILRTPDTLIANNMTNMLYNRWGDIVRGALDNLATAAEKGDPAMRAEMLAAGDVLQNSFADWRRVYSEQAGRVLNDNEVGLRYVQDQLNSWRRHVVTEEGRLDFSRLVTEGERSLPSSIGEIGPIKPDLLAEELGYADGAALRNDVTGHIEKINGEFVLVKGEHDIPWLEEQLRTQLRAHPDYVKRASAYFGSNWADFWGHLSRGVDEGGLDISAHYAKEAQDLISGIARDRGMDPWEYLSGVVATNIGPADLNTAMGKLAAFLKRGPDIAEDADWGAFFRAHLDPSAQQTLVDEWGKAAGRTVGNVEVPAGFTSNPHVAASGTASTLPRDGIFHVTTASDAVKAGGFKPSTAGGELQGFGSKGDTMNAGRVSVLTNRARAATYQERLTLAVKAARGEADQGAVIDYFMPLYKKAFGDKADEFMVSVAGTLAHGATTPKDVYQLAKLLDGGLIGSRLDDVERAVKLTASFDEVKGIDPAQISMLELATKDKAVVKQGIDAGELTLAPEDLHVLGSGSADTGEFFDKGIIEMLKARVASGPHPNADVEGALQHISKLVQTTLKGSPVAGETRSQLRSLVEAIPTSHAVPYNRTHGLVIQLLKDKIHDAQTDIFRLAEMQTKRSVLERSMNHPLFGLYPASYMWGKVMPETVKFLAKNPYAATYTIANVQRSIAIQREYDHQIEEKISSVDRSAGAFLLDYMTPGLPWSDHSARLSPLVRDLLARKGLDQIWSDELATVSPDRWIRQVISSLKEVPGAIESLQQSDQSGQLGGLQGMPGLEALAGGGGAPAPSGPSQPGQITGPTKGSALGPILADDLARLQSILLSGASAEK